MLCQTQVLRLSSCEQISDNGIRALCAGAAAHALADLDLRDCDRLTDSAALAIGRHLSNLRALNLEHCHRISPRCLMLLVCCMRLLRLLHLQGLCRRL